MKGVGEKKRQTKRQRKEKSRHDKRGWRERSETEIRKLKEDREKIGPSYFCLPQRLPEMTMKKNDEISKGRKELDKFPGRDLFSNIRPKYIPNII